jgi:sarcosine oxidase
MRRFPAFRVPPDFIGVFQPDGGFVRAEATVAALQRIARDAGAELRFDEFVAAIEPRRDGVLVKTAQESIRAGAAIVAAGPWLTSLMPRIKIPIRVTRQVLGWFAPADAARTMLSSAGGFPVFLLQNPDGIFYGFPADQDGIKVAKHHHAGETVHPDHYDRTVSAIDEALIRAGLKAHLPDADGDLRAARTCLYTMTPDDDFILDRLPDAPQIIVASPCSGHGFKFAPVIGKILADLAVTGGTHHDISRFSLARFTG